MDLWSTNVVRVRLYFLPILYPYFLGIALGGKCLSHTCRVSLLIVPVQVLGLALLASRGSCVNHPWSNHWPLVTLGPLSIFVFITKIRESQAVPQT